MWPMLLDYSDDECRGILRKLELEAYASIISAFRAQGELNKDKKKMLQELSAALNIPVDRHRAEIRRAVNDEHLNTVADRMAGPNTITDWAIEGRRVVPLMPRAIPQTAYTVVANYAADAQAARNATMPVPSATGQKGGLSGNIISGQQDGAEKSSYKSEASENGEPSRKRCSSPEPSVIAEKLMALEHLPTASGSSSGTDNASETSGDVLVHCNSPIPRCVLQSVLGLDVTPKNNSALSTVSTNATSLIQPAKFIISSAPCQPTSTGSVQTTLNMPGTKAPFSSGSITSATGTQFAKSSDTSLEHVLVSGENVPPGSASLPSLSYSTGNTQSVKALPAPLSSPFVSKPRTKVPASPKALLRPRLPSTSTPQYLSFPTSSPPVTSSPLSSLQKNVSPIKFRSSTGSSTLSSVSSSITTSCSMTMSPQTMPRPQSPIASLTKVTVPSTSIHRTPSPVAPKPMQSSITIGGMTKSTIGTRILTKPAPVRPTLSTKPVVTTVTKSPAIKTPITISTAQVRQPTPLKTPFSAQLFGTPKSNATITYSSKMIPGSTQIKTTGPTIAKTIHYRSEGGLKIISQSLPTNRILPKPPAAMSPQTTIASPVRLTTTNAAALTGNARIVNFTQPISARFARALPPTSVSAVNIPNVPVGGLRVALPVGMSNSQVVRSTIPAKPNVIVVHKAQMWPQAAGGTIVMTSSGSLSRLSNEAIEEAVTMMQRQDPGRHTGSTTGFKTLTVHHGSPFTSAPSITTHSKISLPVSRKVELSTTESLVGRSSELQSTEHKIKVLKMDSISTPLLLPESQKDAAQKKDLNSAIKSIVTTSPIVISSVEKTSDSNTIIKKMKVSSTEDSARVSSTISNDAKPLPLKPKVVFSKDQSSNGSKGTVLASSEAETSPSIQKPMIDESNKEKSKNTKAKAPAKQDPSSPKVNIPDFNLEQLQEGEVIEMQAQDAAELLSQHGQLSTEVIELLQQAGLQVEHIEVCDNGSSLNKNPGEDESSHQTISDIAEMTDNPKPESVPEISSSDKTNDLKSESTEVQSIAGESEAIDVDEPCDSQSQESQEEKSNSADLFVKSDTESQCNEDIFLAPVDSSDAEGSTNVSQASKEELTSLQATESLGDSPSSSQSSLGSLNPNNINVEIEDLDNSNTLLTDNSVS